MVSKSMLYRSVASLVILGALSSSALAASDANNVNQLTRQTWEIGTSTGGMVVDVSGESRNNGAPVITYRDHQGNNQRWQAIPVTGGRFILRNANSLRLLRQQGGGLVQDTYNPGRGDSAYFEWTITQPVPGLRLFTLQNNGSGQYLTYNNGNLTMANRAPRTTVGSGQNWRFLAAQGAPIPTYRTCL